MSEIKEREENVQRIVVILIVLGLLLLFSLVSVKADPISPDTVNITANETKSPPGSQVVNISGGYIATMDLNSTTQNPRWKAFVGQVSGLFTLDDASGSTIYDWVLSSITGEVYATRTSSSPSWGGINCSNITLLNAENTAMNHTSSNDNLNVTFNYSAGATHSAFVVASVGIGANSCPTLNTYINNESQDTDFEEIVLHDGTNTVYATIMEKNVVGFDGNTYDFQMVVPERGDPGYNSSTAYYIYVELGS